MHHPAHSNRDSTLYLIPHSHARPSGIHTPHHRWSDSFILNHIESLFCLEPCNGFPLHIVQNLNVWQTPVWLGPLTPLISSSFLLPTHKWPPSLSSDKQKLLICALHMLASIHTSLFAQLFLPIYLPLPGYLFSLICLPLFLFLLFYYSLICLLLFQCLLLCQLSLICLF